MRNSQVFFHGSILIYFQIQNIRLCRLLLSKQHISPVQAELSLRRTEKLGEKVNYGLANVWPLEWPFIKSIKCTAFICQSLIPVRMT